jgi:RimJ/RimL family protein N-acetyltransferase
MNRFKTPRLSLNPLTVNDTEFIRRLVNTPGWIKFIGNRNVNTPEEAIAYTQKLIDNPSINYWVVTRNDDQTAVGVVTLIKHDYLEHWDIGFAFLPDCGKQGFAFEAASAVLHDTLKNPLHSNILAVCVKENVSSIKLLEKLGLRFIKEIQKDDEALNLFGIGTDRIGEVPSF